MVTTRDELGSGAGDRPTGAEPEKTVEDRIEELPQAEASGTHARRPRRGEEAT